MSNAVRKNSIEKKAASKGAVKETNGNKATSNRPFTPPATAQSINQEEMQLQGICENNLKNLNLTLPHNQLVAITGLSGSGKSSLAFDTLYAEAGRRYIETFSPYTRQFLDRLHKPEIFSASGLRPALALEQRNRITSSRSTVGSITETNDYLKILWSELADIVCPTCKSTVALTSPAIIYQEMANSLTVGKKRKQPIEALLVGFPVDSHPENRQSLLGILQNQGFVRCFLPSRNSIYRLDSKEVLTDPDKQLLIVSRRFAPEAFQPEMKDSETIAGLTEAMKYGKGKVVIITKSSESHQINEFQDGYHCRTCSTSFSRPSSSIFSFNNPLGACPSCKGFGSVLRVSEALVVPDPRLSIAEGALQCWEGPAAVHEKRGLLNFCKNNDIETNCSWQSLPEAAKLLIFNSRTKKPSFYGVIPWFKWLETKTYKMHVRVFLSRYRSQVICDDCSGTRLRPEALNYRLHGYTLPEIWSLPLCQLTDIFTRVDEECVDAHLKKHVIPQVQARIDYLNHIGLDYLTLDRQSRTLSGGEAERVNLTNLLGSNLVHTTLILDEPTVGLHYQDTNRLIDALKVIRDRGNSVIVVEHDKDVINSADIVVDLGPQSGSQGGEIVFQGTPGEMLKSGTLTARYQSESFSHESSARKVDATKAITVTGARVNNLRNVSVALPTNALTVIAGVSGSGKSSFLHETLNEAWQCRLKGRSTSHLLETFDGLEHISTIALIDQSPVAKNPRSNPATYTKTWDHIRDILSTTEDAQKLGLSKSSFSFNVDGGRCPVCKGAGEERVEMQFLADVFVSCEACQGTRFQQAVQTVRYEGLSVIDFLKMTISDAVSFFNSTASNSTGHNKSSEEILKRLEPLAALGLGYLTLGQPLNTLSGGEAQRVKLSSYLLNNSEPTLFLLDEPTTGLHPHNVQQLLNVFDLLIDRGHSIVCIEHNLDVIRAADWIVEFGPGGGEHGGEVIAASALPDYLKNRKQNNSLPTWKALHSETDRSSKAMVPTRERSLEQENYSPSTAPSIHIAGARHHNLKNIALDIPHNKINVLTGVSGSGKSSLAFDIVFQEGQRRYIDCLSPYARQYIKQLSRADVDRVEGLPPTIAVSQKTAVSAGISTVATTTEIYQYLRLLYCKAGEQLCPDHNLPVRNLSAEGIADSLVERFSGKQIYIFAPVISGRKGYHNDIFRRAINAEMYSGRIDGEFSSFSEDTRLERHKLHWISLLVGNITVAPTKRSILTEAISQALVLSDGTVEVCLKKSGDEPAVYSTKRVCPKCLRGFHDLDPQDFSFRSRRGKCGKCAGRGVIEQRGKTVTCPECEGSRLGTIGRNVLYAEKRIHELTAMNASELLKTLQSTPVNLRLQPIIAPIMSEVIQRLKLIEDIGLDYLRLDRESDSLSGGEAQRLRLATAVGSPLTGVCYVFDEPTIGLHASDHENLFSVFRKIRDMGNTLLIVEHDEDTILNADYLIDMGPGGGSQGGNVVAAGTPSELIKDGSSVTALCLQKRSLRAQTSASDRKTTGTELVAINGARCNNLQHVDASFPAQALTVVAGLSGAGKSSLVHGVLTPAIEQTLAKKKSKKSEQLWSELILPETIKRLIEIDQSAIGKTPASTPASFLGVFDELRKLFASLPEAKLLGFDAGHFSYNSAKGRCPTCGGKGFVKVPMSFLPDAVSTCEECLGLRYKSEILKVTFQGLSIGEVLNQTFSDTLTLFSTHRRIKDKLKLVCDLGLGYIKIGQPTFTLSGGEAQRLKICRELASSQSSEILYILDEPTVGLHMSDVELLLNMLRALVERGNTVLVIEHNLDVIQAADHILEMGPGAGPAGGKLIFSGTPQELRKLKKKTATSKVLG